MLKSSLALTCATLALGASIDYTPSLQWGHAIEGANYMDGHLYAVHWRGTTNSSTAGNAVGRNVIGRLNIATQVAEPFFTGPAEAVFNGIEWSADRQYMLLADVANKRVLNVNLATKAWTVYCESPDFIQGLPNDLVLTKDGKYLYLSGQEWAGGADAQGLGSLWMCEPDGTTTQLVTPTAVTGRTNGIALSPDESLLYLSEAIGSGVKLGGYQRIHQFARTKATGLVGAKQPFYSFVCEEAAVDVDGMQCDNAGNLYVTRNGNGKVVVIAPDGSLKQTIVTTNSANNNLVLTNDTLYVTVRCNAGGAWNMGNGCWEAFPISNPATTDPITSSTGSSTTADPDTTDTGTTETSTGTDTTATGTDTDAQGDASPAPSLTPSLGALGLLLFAAGTPF